MPTSAVLMTRAVLFLILMIVMGQTAAAQADITREQSIFTIDVKENGNALWQEEKFYPLESKSAVSEWNLSMKDLGNISKKKGTDINEGINRSLLSAQNYSGRPMRIDNLNITYDLVDTPSNSYGVIRLSFEWVNFSRINSSSNGSSIIIGEAFSEGVVPSSDRLVIRIPEGYDIVNVSPSYDKRDGNKLIWDGTMYRSFAKGEPSLIITKKEAVASEDSFLQVLIFPVVLVLAGAGVLLLWNRNRIKANFAIKRTILGPSEGGSPETGNAASPVSPEVTGSQEAVEPSQPVIPEAPAPDMVPQAGIKYPEPQPQNGAGLPPITEEILGDEEMIERYLIKFGGQAYQSDIVTESGLSKSKISIVLAKMKDDGRILKIRKGKENIIRLVKKE